MQHLPTYVLVVLLLASSAIAEQAKPSQPPPAAATSQQKPQQSVENSQWAKSITDSLSAQASTLAKIQSESAALRQDTAKVAAVVSALQTKQDEALKAVASLDDRVKGAVSTSQLEDRLAKLQGALHSSIAASAPGEDSTKSAQALQTHVDDLHAKLHSALTASATKQSEHLSAHSKRTEEAARTQSKQLKSELKASTDAIHILSSSMKSLAERQKMLDDELHKLNTLVAKLSGTADRQNQHLQQISKSCSSSHFEWLKPWQVWAQAKCHSAFQSVSQTLWPALKDAYAYVGEYLRNDVPRLANSAFEQGKTHYKEAHTFLSTNLEQKTAARDYCNTEHAATAIIVSALALLLWVLRLIFCSCCCGSRGSKRSHTRQRSRQSNGDSASATSDNSTKKKKKKKKKKDDSDSKTS